MKIASLVGYITRAAWMWDKKQNIQNEDNKGKKGSHINVCPKNGGSFDKAAIKSIRSFS